MPSAFYPLLPFLEEPFMNCRYSLVLAPFTVINPLAADMYCDMNTFTGGVDHVW